MATDYIVRLKCPHGDRDQLLTLENRKESLQQILDSPLDFECPVHGVQREIPLEGRQKSAWSESRLPKRGPKRTDVVAAPQPRSSKRISLHVPVLVCGRSQEERPFQEETTTLLVNAGGALLPLDSRVTLGDKISISNRATHQEQECRVAYVDMDPHGKLRVGAAFNHPVPHFWRIVRRESRISKNVRVKVRGVDQKGDPFTQSTYAVDISRQGARLDGIGFLTLKGEIIELRRNFRSARFRVVWIGQIGTPQAGQAGLLALDPTKDIWGITSP